MAFQYFKDVCSSEKSQLNILKHLEMQAIFWIKIIHVLSNQFILLSAVGSIDNS